MSKLLYLQASPLPDRSYSIAVADTFIKAYREFNPKDEIIRKNLFEEDLPSFDGLKLTAKYTILHGQKHTEGQLAAWRAVEAVIEEFKSADKYVLAVPMWNFGIPYRLKHYIDILVQPTYTFSFSPQEGYKGLVTGKPIFLTYARGGEYPQGSGAEGMDFQKRYLDLILGFIGFKDICSLVVEPTLMGGSEVAANKRDDATSRAWQMAKDF